MNYKNLLGISSQSMNDTMNSEEGMNEVKDFHADVVSGQDDIGFKIAQVQGLLGDVKDAVNDAGVNNDNLNEELSQKLDVLSEGIDRVVEALGSSGSGGSGGSDNVTLEAFNNLSNYITNNRIRHCKTRIYTQEASTRSYGTFVDCSRIECGRIIKLTNTHSTNPIKIIDSSNPNTYYMLEAGETIENINLGVQQQLQFDGESKEISYKIIYEKYQAY